MKFGYVLFSLIFLSNAIVQAHEMRPGYLEIREIQPGTYDVIWKVPARGIGERFGLNVQFAEDVQQLVEPVGGFRADSHIQKMQIYRAGGLSGTPVTIGGLTETFTDVLLRLEHLDGTELMRRLTPDQPTIVIEASPSLGRVAWTYFELGVEHILLGVDHLLFVLALLLIVSDWKKLIGTVTAFTVAHSLTLALATLGFVNIPGPPVEAIIALSIVFVAAEMIRGRQGQPGLTALAPWLVAFTFGLLHGFGFAGALSDVGLPQSSIPMALLAFNLGVEGGQLVFVGVAIGAYAIVQRAHVAPPEWVCRIPAYAIGSVAAFWTMERITGF